MQAVAIADGMVTLRQSALLKAIAGETTLKEINRVTFVD
jgi:type IV pilus assembly protein PilB